MKSNIERYLDLLGSMKGYSLDQLKAKFLSENIYECYAASTVLGDRMSIGSEEEEFILSPLTKTDSKSIHSLRHAFGALPIYARILMIREQLKDQQT